MKVILYSTNCPRCKVLKAKLTQKKLDYETITDINVMLNLGIRSAPILEVDGKRYDFTQAIDFVNKL